MNTLNAVNEGKLKEQSFKRISWFLLLDCLDILNWKIYEVNTTPSGTFVKVDTGNNKIVCTKEGKDTITILNEVH